MITLIWSLFNNLFALHYFSIQFTDEDAALLNSLELTSHRITDVPLCQSDCDDWWAACNKVKIKFCVTIITNNVFDNLFKELTCTNNWYKGFDWEQGDEGNWNNVCKNKTTSCKPINKWFSSSTHFCEVT